MFSNLACFYFQLPFETEVYFVQHFLMMIIPYYLMSIGGKLNICFTVTTVSLKLLFCILCWFVIEITVGLYGMIMHFQAEQTVSIQLNQCFC